MKKTCVLYLHGLGGAAAECERFRPLFPAADVLGLDYKSFTPWETGEEIRAAASALKRNYETLALIANSIGAYFSLSAGIGGLLRKAYFISPVVDMEALILGMMKKANVTEAALREAGELTTAAGETLSWQYLRYVRAHPVRWNADTAILYGENDALVPFETVKAFAAAVGASLTVMPGGEHWFHTPEQLRFLEAWLEKDER